MPTINRREANEAAKPDYSAVVLPPDLEWYDELGGQRTGWVAEVNGPGWWHLEELNLLPESEAAR